MTTKITLKGGKEESLARHHPWIFSGAIASSEGSPEEGDIVDVYSNSGQFLARGHCQIGAIAVRVLTFSQEEIDQQWWNERIANAYRVRVAIGVAENSATTCYRLVHGEGDMLPGLIVDIYGNTAVIQCHSVGMYLARAMVVVAIMEAYGARIEAIYDKSVQTLPYKAETGAMDGYLVGSAAQANDTVLENGLSFEVSWEKGQKTGFFIDQRYARELVRSYSAGRKVLNTFCYTGGFSVYALAGGALHVDSVDSSARAMELAVRNVELNFGPSAPHNAITADALDYVKTMPAGYDLVKTMPAGYDLVVLDPPAFAKHHKVLGNALQGYRRLNANALSKIESGGILFTFSCSQAVSKEQFRTTIFSAASIAGRKVRILHQLTQPADHPINIYHPEGEYLKGLVLYVE